MEKHLASATVCEGRAVDIRAVGRQRSEQWGGGASRGEAAEI
jgi:hypothetical protein